jgi:hypothetical protein
MGGTWRENIFGRDNLADPELTSAQCSFAERRKNDVTSGLADVFFILRAQQLSYPDFSRLSIGATR